MGTGKPKMPWRRGQSVITRCSPSIGSSLSVKSVMQKETTKKAIGVDFYKNNIRVGGDGEALSC